MGDEPWIFEYDPERKLQSEKWLRKTRRASLPKSKKENIQNQMKDHYVLDIQNMMHTEYTSRTESQSNSIPCGSWDT